MDKGHTLGRVEKLPGTYPTSREIGDLHLARVVEVIAPGRYVVSLPAGGAVEVEGEPGLRVGSPVRVLKPANGLLKAAQEPGVPWEALIPLGFGGKNAKAELKVYVERVGDKTSQETKPAVYLILECVTELQGKSQWSIYLRGNSVQVQVYPGDGVDAGERFLSLVREVEESLKKKGFRPAGSTVILKKRFSLPRGFHLNIKG
jgi:hypothetical protein